MVFSTSWLLIVVLALVSTPLIKADLPSHCLKWQVLGTWDFKISAPKPESPSCGHTRPDNMVSVYVKKLGYDNPGFSVVASGNFTLLSNYSDNAILCFSNTCEAATWTMVYDEAMSIRGSESGMELLFQFVYVPKTPLQNNKYPDPKQASKWKTFCDRTYPGWYELGQSMRGCAVAKNRVSQKAQPSASLMNDDDGDVMLHLKSGLKMALADTFRSEFMQQRSFDFSVLQEEAVLINQRQKFWVADASAASFAKDYSNRDAFASVGGSTEKLLKPKSYSLDSITDPQARATESKRRKCIRRVLPNSWDWSDKNFTQTAVINQGSCGSCYVVSSADAFTSRLRLKKQSNVGTRSAKAILQCSATNQGCDGGFPWLVGHHARYEGLYSESCTGPYSTGPIPASSPLAKCDFSSETCQAEKEVARAWGYVGGYYGRGNTEDMMWSLFRDGPLVVAINAQSDLFLYRSGLFMSNPSAPADVAKHKEAYWEATTHAVVVTGWGYLEFEQVQVETWKLKNSWGPEWGEAGYFNIQRGVDAMAVESMPVHVIFGDGKPGNPDFESYVHSKLSEINDAECTAVIERMLSKELV